MLKSKVGSIQINHFFIMMNDGHTLEGCRRKFWKHFFMVHVNFFPNMFNVYCYFFLQSSKHDREACSIY